MKLINFFIDLIFTTHEFGTENFVIIENFN